MPTFRSGAVVRMLSEREGLQRVEVDLDGRSERAYVLTELTGTVAVGDRVVVNTTAVDLGLGTGGWHVVHWNLERAAWSRPGDGHIMKLRYTSLQRDTGCVEEHAEPGVLDGTLGGMPVVVAGLHSQVAAVVGAIAELRPSARVAYVMTDGAALPIALSDLVASVRSLGWVDATITVGHAFGGDHEAVTMHSALAVARHVVGADIAVVAMGPGVVGTGTRWGHTGIEVAPVLDAAVALHGDPIAVLRASVADPRPRHHGISHHSRTALGAVVRSRVTVPVPSVTWDLLAADLEDSGIAERHAVVRVEHPDPVEFLSAAGLEITTMGRPAHIDRLPFDCAAAAGAAAVAASTREPDADAASS